MDEVKRKLFSIALAQKGEHLDAIMRHGVASVEAEKEEAALWAIRTTIIMLGFADEFEEWCAKRSRLRQREKNVETVKEDNP